LSSEESLSEIIENSIYSNPLLSSRAMFLHNAKTREDRLPPYLIKKLKSRIKKKAEDKDYDQITLKESLASIKKKVTKEK
jgi:hypothetical protein